jgi:Fe-S cluster assembly protein SufD
MSAIVDFPVKPEARPYLEAFGRGAFGRGQGEPDWLAGYRKGSLARFAELGFPSRRIESWRYLDLRALEQKPLLPASRKSTIGPAIRTQLAEIGLAEPAYRLVLANGRFAPELSAIEKLPAGVWLGSMAVAIVERPDLVRAGLEANPLDAPRPFAALNAAFFADGFVLDIPPGITLDRPVEIIHLSSSENAGSLHTRSLVTLGEGSRVRLVESFTGLGNYWRNDVVELRLGAGSELGRVTLVEESGDALHLGEVLATLGSASRLSTTVDHAAPGGETREIFKGVAAGRAHGAFQGRITVRSGAQKVDAHQLSRNLVLGPRAAIDTKPELEIYADDVKCSHGATVGDLDEAALFYLRARGIPSEEARRMLITAFVEEAVELVDSPPLREHLRTRLARRLAMLEE